MADSKIKAAHLDLTHEWRGGQQQVFYLHQALIELNQDSVVICAEGSELAMRCREKKLPFYTVKKEWAFSPILAFRIARFLRKNQIQILQAHSSHALSLALLVKIFFLKVILVASRRVDFHVKKPLIGVLKYDNPLLAMNICISEAIKQIMIEDGVSSKRLTTIHSGVDCTRFKHSGKPQNKLKEELNIPADQQIIGTIAALADHKDYPTLLQAAKLVLKQNPNNVTFLAVGDGPKRNVIFKLHKELGLGEKFIFCGYRTDIADLLSLFDIFVLSSKTEGMGTSLLDAQCAGLPVIASKTGGIPEIVHNNENGILVAAQAPEQLAVAISILENDRHLRKQLADNAKKFAQQFNYRETANKTLKLYKSLI